MQANLKNAILERAVFTRSDLGGANVEGADFTNALLDKTQQMVGIGLLLGVLSVIVCSHRHCGTAVTKLRAEGPQAVECWCAVGLAIVQSSAHTMI